MIWEIFTNAKEPYEGMKTYEVQRKILKERYRMSPPEGMPLQIAQLMYRCWEQDPLARLTFAALVTEFESEFERIASENTTLLVYTSGMSGLQPHRMAHFDELNLIETKPPDRQRIAPELMDPPTPWREPSYANEDATQASQVFSAEQLFVKLKLTQGTCFSSPFQFSPNYFGDFQKNRMVNASREESVVNDAIRLREDGLLTTMEVT